jgi:hypothetical protein
MLLVLSTAGDDATDDDTLPVRADDIVEWGPGAGVWSPESIAELGKLAPFDLVRCAGCLDRVPDVPAAMRAIAAALAPGDSSVAFISGQSETAHDGVEGIRWVLDRITGKGKELVFFFLNFFLIIFLYGFIFCLSSCSDSKTNKLCTIIYIYI